MMNSLQDLLKNRIIEQGKKSKVTQEFQVYGAYLAEELDDKKNISMYIRFAKLYPRSHLQQALSFVSDSQARSKRNLFMWKLKQLRSREWLR